MSFVSARPCTHSARTDSHTTYRFERCAECENYFTRPLCWPSAKFCSKLCANRTRHKAKGAAHPGFKHGIGPKGYRRITTPDGRRMDEHRYVMEQKLGRRLLRHETVHHIDGNKTNNDAENLQLRVGMHGHGVEYSCGDCGSANIVPGELK